MHPIAQHQYANTSSHLVTHHQHPTPTSGNDPQYTSPRLTASNSLPETPLYGPSKILPNKDPVPITHYHLLLRAGPCLTLQLSAGHSQTALALTGTHVNFRWLLGPVWLASGSPVGSLVPFLSI